MKTIPANEVLDPKKDLEKNQKKEKKKKKNGPFQDHPTLFEKIAFCCK